MTERIVIDALGRGGQNCMHILLLWLVVELIGDDLSKLGTTRM